MTPAPATWSRVALLQGGGPEEALFTLPALASLRRALPAAQLDVIASSAAAAVLRLSDQASSVTVARGSPEANLGLLASLALLRRERYELAVVPDHNRTALLAVFLAGVPARAAPVGWPGHLFVTHGGVTRQRQHRVDDALRVVAACGVSVEDPPLRLPVPAMEAQEAATRADQWSGGLPLIAFIPGGVPAGQASRAWPAERWALLARLLLENCAARLVIAGEPGETALLESVVGDIPFAVATWPELADYETAVAMLAQCTVVVANDSVWLHLAVAAGARCAGIYGPTSAALRGPYGGEHLAVQAQLPVPPRRRGRTDELQGADGALARVTVQDVWAALVPLLEEAAAAASGRPRRRPAL
jgi:ADP-heptose:LPS heptosyltransferase